MPGILWSTEEREREWAFAKEKLMPQGKLLPNGSKLRRKDYTDDVNHSFMVIDDRIIALSGKGVHLSRGRAAHVKLAEDEAGSLIALKIITNDGGESNSVRESHIAYDLGIAGQRFTRTSTSKGCPTKNYIAYQYLGTRLVNYLDANKALSLDKRYELCIKISLALHEIHTGKKTKSKKSYQHNDIHWGTLLIDEQEEPHFIGYGRFREAYGKNEADIVQMLLLFFTPIKDRIYKHENWIFGDWVGKYDFSYSPPEFDPEEEKREYYLKKQTIHIYLNRDDKNADDAFPIIRFAVLDPYGIFHEETLNLSDIGIDNIIPKLKQFSWIDIEQSKRKFLESKVLEITNRNGYTISQENRNEILFNLLKDPTAFYRTPEVPTALDIAETLTLCRLQLETFQSAFATRPQNAREEAVHILNSMNIPLLALYEKLKALPKKSSGFDEFIKNYIVSHLVVFPKDEKDSFADTLNLQLAILHEDDARSLRQNIDDIIIGINHTRESWQAKNTPVLRDESSLQHQQQLPDVLEPEPDEISPANQTEIVSKIDVAPIIISHEGTEPVVKADQGCSEQTIKQAEQDFLRELKNLQATVNTIAIEEQQSAVNLQSRFSLMTLKQQRARQTAFNEANRVLQELHKQLPLTEDGKRLQSLNDEALLIRLADICSHTAQGLHFVAAGGVPFSCTMFCATNNTSGTLRQVNYDVDMHKSNMAHLSETASSLQGSGWKKLRNTLFILAGLMLVACGILAAIPTGGTSLLLGLGGAAVLTAGVGFFAGRDTGFAGAVGGVQMKML